MRKSCFVAVPEGPGSFRKLVRKLVPNCSFVEVPEASGRFPEPCPEGWQMHDSGIWLGKRRQCDSAEEVVWLVALRP